MAVSLAITGCKKNDTAATVDTANLENSFASADATTKSSVDKAVAAIKSADYSGALTELKSIGERAKLTPEQEQAIKDVIAQVEKAFADMAGKATDAAEKAADDANKALGDIQKSIGK